MNHDDFLHGELTKRRIVVVGAFVEDRALQRVSRFRAASISLLSFLRLSSHDLTGFRDRRRLKEGGLVGSASPCPSQGVRKAWNAVSEPIREPIREAQ